MPTMLFFDLTLVSYLLLPQVLLLITQALGRVPTRLFLPTQHSSTHVLLSWILLLRRRQDHDPLSSEPLLPCRVRRWRGKFFSYQMIMNPSLSKDTYIFFGCSSSFFFFLPIGVLSMASLVPCGQLFCIKVWLDTVCSRLGDRHLCRLLDPWTSRSCQNPSPRKAPALDSQSQ